MFKKTGSVKLKSKKNLWMILIVVVVAVSVVSVILLKKTEDSKEEKPSKTTQTTQKKEPQTVTKNNQNTKSEFVEAVEITINKSEWNLTLLNRNYKLPAGYVPKTAKIKLSENDPRRTQKALNETLDYRVAPEYQKMYDAAVKDGIYLTPCSGYRSVALQESIFNRYVKRYEDEGYSQDKAKYKASNTSLPPGTSEHNMGIAMDIINTRDIFKDSKEYAWLEKNAHNYGFILRYPKDKTQITNVMYEPWHWRYVGVDDAVKIKKSGQCLEEYLGVK